MRITRRQLRQIIQEETGAAIMAEPSAESNRSGHDPTDALRPSRYKNLKDNVETALEALFAKVRQDHQLPFTDDNTALDMTKTDIRAYMQALLSDAHWPWNQVD